jgi:hypothetical protein
MGNNEKQLQRYHRLADVALRTLATILAVLFAYVLASGQLTSVMKIYVTAVWLLILFGIVFSGISLFCGKKEIRVAKVGAHISVLLMFITIAVMILLLSAIMYSMP